MDIYAIVTEKIINLLERGVVPWRKPWTSTGLPRNLVSKRPYNGINYFLLSASKYVSPFWLTYRQATELGGHVRKGEESTIVVFWKVEDLKQIGEDLDAEENNEKNRRRFLLRYYRLFNLEQCELPQAVLDKLPKIETHEHDPIEAAEQDHRRNAQPARDSASGSKAFYSSITDRITLPPRELFISPEEANSHDLPRNESRNRPSEAAQPQIDHAKPRRSARPRIVSRKWSRRCQPPISAPKRESRRRFSRIRPRTSPDG